ncbi:hypothetical protein L798_12781 [Zootermopsis nevadensis]|uniref:Uncharacterized protein n=1 Tax=Zootermopsis nevadensis TaxID=136037 RepID=A0A067RI32_ZOONE|nr:hypothetical protein L798_12781 [Zootermopsis nevadensis]
MPHIRRQRNSREPGVDERDREVHGFSPQSGHRELGHRDLRFSSHDHAHHPVPRAIVGKRAPRPVCGHDELRPAFVTATKKFSNRTPRFNATDTKNENRHWTQS